MLAAPQPLSGAQGGVHGVWCVGGVPSANKLDILNKPADRILATQTKEE